MNESKALSLARNDFCHELSRLLSVTVVECKAGWKCSIWKLATPLVVYLRDLTNIELLGTMSNFPIRGQPTKIHFIQ